jgi:6-phosphogluconolactonase (cycloisomerase 2 family)
MFGVDSTGALVTIGAPLSAGGHSHSINVDPRGRFVYVSNEDDPANIHLSGYTINGTTGVLTPIPGPLPVAAGAQASVFDRNGNYLYVITGIAVSTIAAYAVDQTTGVLTQIGSSLSAGTHAHNLTVDPANTFLYVASGEGSNSILTYAIDQTNGVLTSVGPPVPGAFRPAAVAIHPSGAFAYVVDEGDLVKLFTVDQTTGALTPNTVLPQTGATPGGRPHSIVIDTTGNFVYVGNIDTADISAWRIDQVTGELVPLTGPPPLLNFSTGIRPHSLAVTNGGFLYAANNGSDTISRFAINSTTGELTLLDTFDDPDPAVIEGLSGIGITNIP